ncbi:hypothetical protein FMM68_05970 [Lachnospiraceae bacterium MD329]|nr:hypothetical protein [Lachnospiraceae bacterium MD329]
MKKLISFILWSVIVTSLVTTVTAVEYGTEYTNQPTKTYTQKFKDVPTSHWAFLYIGEMTEREVVSGYPNGNFYPDNNVTRAEFARIMTSASGLQISTPTQRDFSDVATDAWYAPYIHAAYSYLSGYQIYGGSYYKPDTPALREDIAVALVKLKGYDTLGADESLLTTMFTDADSISGDARKYVAVALERGLVSGYEDNTFRGQASISRAEATAMLWRAYQYGNDNKTFDNLPTTAPITSTAPIVTQAPVISTLTPVETEKPVVTAAPTEKPTPEPTEAPKEKPYVMNTVTKAKISDTFTMMTTDGENIYYYDESNKNIYSLNMSSEEVKSLLDVSEFEIEAENKKNVDVTEYYKDFRIKRLYYDEKTDGLIMEGIFYKITDYYGLSDKYAEYNAIVNISDNCKICNEDEVGEPITFVGFYNSGFEIKNGNNLYSFYTGNDSASLSKYNFNSSEWERIQNMMNYYYTHIGYCNDNFYALSFHTGDIIKCELNTKLTRLDINVLDNVEVIDFQRVPQREYHGRSQMFLKDENTVFLYDTDASLIRVIKEK